MLAKKMIEETLKLPTKYSVIQSMDHVMVQSFEVLEEEGLYEPEPPPSPAFGATRPSRSTSSTTALSRVCF